MHASTFLDVTEAQHDPGPSSQTHTVFDVLPGIDITFTAQGESGSEPYLSWNTSSNPDTDGDNDGEGVENGGGYEKDEVEFPEMLLIEFSDTVIANNFYLTDFFIERGAFGSSLTAGSVAARFWFSGACWHQEADEALTPPMMSNIK